MLSSVPLPTDVLHVLLRRWYLALAGVLSTGALVLAVFLLVPVQYSARADVLLVPPTAQITDNPLLGLGGLEDVPATVARSVFTDAAVASLAQHGITHGYDVTIDPTTSAPLLIATATADTPTAALTAMHRVADLVTLALTRIQAAQHVPKNALISATILHADTTPTTETRTRTRALFATIAGGLLLTGLLTITTDRILLHRRRRAGTRRVVDAGDRAAVRPGVRIKAATTIRVSDRDTHPGRAVVRPRPTTPGKSVAEG